MRKTMIFIISSIVMLSCGTSNKGVNEKVLPEATSTLNIRILKEELQKNPADAQTHFQLGMAYAEKDSTDLALARMDSAIHHNPSFTQAKIEKGDLLIKKNRIKEGYTQFLEVLKKEKDEDITLTIARKVGQPFPVQELTSGDHNNAYGYYSPGGNRIVFQSDRDGNWEIYLMDAKGAQHVRLTNHPAQDEMPIFFNDGKIIAFTSTRDDEKNVDRVNMKRNIYLMDIEGNREALSVDSEFDDWYPSFTDKENELIFTSEKDDPRDVKFEDRLSDIYLKNLKTNEIRRLTQNEADDGSPSVSRNGKWIVFNSNRNGKFQIFRMDKKGELVEQLTSFEGNCGAPHFSHDGQKLTFFAEVNGNYDIYMMTITGEKLTRLTHHEAQDAYPCFSPDSKNILFHSNRTGKFQLYLIDLLNPLSYDDLVKQIEEKLALAD